MKKTTSKLLLWLYVTDESGDFFASMDQLRIILPDLSSSGFRSLINLMKKQKYISVENVEEDTRVRITTYGRKHLEAHFPALLPINEQSTTGWALIVFLSPPKSDMQFRYLRKFLLDEGSSQLTRGVYLCPNPIPSKIKDLLQKLYIGSVVVIEIGNWVFGDERTVINESFALIDLHKTYSGISAEIDQLLKEKNEKKVSKDQQNQSICLVFDRLLSAMSEDLGLLQRQFTDPITAKILLERLHTFL